MDENLENKILKEKSDLKKFYTAITLAGLATGYLYFAESINNTIDCVKDKFSKEQISNTQQY